MTVKATRAQRLKQASLKRREQDKAETRRAILDAAVALFQEHGFENFSLRGVAEAIGYSPTTIYLYFADKDDLLFHTAMEGFVKFGEMLQAAYDGAATPLERFGATGRAYVKFGLENPVPYRLMFMQRGEFLERDAPPGYESIIDSFGVLTQALQECLDAGVIKPGDLRTYAGMAWANVHGVVALAISTPYIDERAAYGILELYQTSIIEGMKAEET